MAAALAMFIVAPAMSQQPVMDPSQADARAIHEQATGGRAIHEQATGGFEVQQTLPTVTVPKAGGTNAAVSPLLVGEPIKFWLGIYCSPVPPALRSHLTLPERQGVLAMVITKDSPAAKAGIAQYDILLRAGGKPLVDPRDLAAAVDAAKETKLKIDLIRGGKPQTIEVTPAKRPDSAPAASVQMPEQADWNTIESWLENMMPAQGGPGAQPPAQFRIFHPGAIVPRNMLAQKPLPTNMSVVVTKEGDQPAKITVKRNNDTWEVTEKDLDKLPADVRPFVEQMLGRGMVGIVGGAVPSMPGGISGSVAGGNFQFNVPPGMMPPQPFPGNPDQQMMAKRFDEMNRRMDQLFKMMEDLTEGHGHPAPKAPEHHAEK
jgi:membrane-associated protease RseP (regulator of RpoE activity)